MAQRDSWLSLRKMGAQVSCSCLNRNSASDVRVFKLLDASVTKTRGKPVKEQVNNRCGIERKNLAYQQAADDGNTERPAQFRSDAGSKCQWQATKQRRHRGHHDGTETK